MESNIESAIVADEVKELKPSTSSKRKSFDSPDYLIKIETEPSQKKFLTIRPEYKSGLPADKLTPENAENINPSITLSGQSCENQHLEEGKFVNALVSNLLGNVIDNQRDESSSKEISSSVVNDPILQEEIPSKALDIPSHNAHVNSPNIKSAEFEDKMLIGLNDKNPMHSIEV